MRASYRGLGAAAGEAPGGQAARQGAIVTDQRAITRRGVAVSEHATRMRLWPRTAWGHCAHTRAIVRRSEPRQEELPAERQQRGPVRPPRIMRPQRLRIGSLVGCPQFGRQFV